MGAKWTNSTCFCADQGVSLASFGYWRTKWLALHKSEEVQSPVFAPIEKPTPKSVDIKAAQVYEIVYSNGVRLCLPSLDLSILPQLLKLDV
ncbi:IS66 family insertion sequence element accessory protein TnpA [Microscilla marina]|uniref:Uncharacterized protein n=1 Tax=Microscilla marina ATCC 23134 TaxID=313606 RepID=A1ZIJ5_MICM2|nr:hypothetical protein M23134_05736 [Microscilla marina ATCC 23134]